MDEKLVARRLDEEWTHSIQPSLEAYIRIPNKSPLFDPQWEAHGHMDRAAALLVDWCRSQPVKGLEVRVIRLPGRTPLIYAEVPGTAPGRVLLYGHFDKQPEFTGWSAGLDPWTPVVRDGRLYGRGGADDGYALYSSLLAIRLLQEQELRRLGSVRSQQVNVRFVAATHRSLETLAEAGIFRWDLLFRLRGSVLELPSLAARRHEFPYLVPRLLASLALDVGHPAPPVAPGLAEALAAVAWPGNFRELRHSLERALLRCGAGPLGPEHFPEVREACPPARRSWAEATRVFQRELLLETLRRHRFSMAQAARELGLARPALYAAARRLGVELALERGRP